MKDKITRVYSPVDTATKTSCLAKSFIIRYSASMKEASFKAKITNSLGTFEFEGSEEFVVKQITRLIEREEAAPRLTPPETTSKSAGAKSSNPIRKRQAGEQPKILSDLIDGKDKLDSLRQFYEEKMPTNQIENFAVLTYWLKSELQMVDVSVDEIWTLYKMLQVRPPKVLAQTFRDGKSKKAYFDITTSTGRYFLTTFGETFVEHDLPKKNKAKKA